MAEDKTRTERARPWLRFRSRPVPIRRSLFRNVLVLILLIGLALAITTTVTGRRAVRILCRSLIQRTVDLTELELNKFFGPMQGLLRVAGEWVASGDLDLENAKAMRQRLTPLLLGVPQISSFNTGDAEGNSYMLLQTGTNWLSREVRRATWGPRARWARWDLTQTAAEEWWEETDYDPRQRPWYAEALQNLGVGATRPSDPNHGSTGRPCWSDPYLFFTRRELGMTVSMVVPPPGKSIPTVIAFDLLLKDISHFTSQLKPSENGFAFVISEDERLIGSPRGSRTMTGLGASTNLVGILEQVGPAAASAGFRTWATIGKPPFEPFRFRSNGDDWWGGFHLVNLGESRRFWVGVMVPQGDFLVDVWQQRANLIVVMAGALAVAVGMVTILSRKYSRPLQALVAQSERIQNLNLERQAHAPSRLVEVESLAQAQERMCCALESFARYVPIGVVRELLRRGAAARLGGQTEVLTVMFSDMEGFTALAEAMSPEVLTNYLAEYFETVERVLDRHQATIDKFIGDSILAFWGAPVPNPDHARAAVLALLEAEDALDDFFVRASARGKPRLRTRFGLATGPVVVGNIGAPDRLNYSVIGNTVNLASRLEGLNRFYGTAVLASGSLVHVAGEGLVWRRVDRVVVKGQTQPVDIFEPLGQTGQVPAQTQEKKSVYESALDLLQIRQFQEALRLLHGPGRPFEKDLSFQRLAERCEHLLHEPPPPDWDTSFRFRDK